eukprot:11228326-Lingulodinium_polyedra.AAC.2
MPLAMSTSLASTRRAARTCGASELTSAQSGTDTTVGGHIGSGCSSMAQAGRRAGEPEQAGRRGRSRPQAGRRG